MRLSSWVGMNLSRTGRAHFDNRDVARPFGRRNLESDGTRDSGRGMRKRAKKNGRGNRPSPFRDDRAQQARPGTRSHTPFEQRYS